MLGFVDAAGHRRVLGVSIEDIVPAPLSQPREVTVVVETAHGED